MRRGLDQHTQINQARPNYAWLAENRDLEWSSGGPELH